MESHRHFLEEALFMVLGERLKVVGVRNLSGGCIHSSEAVVTSKGTFFIKWNVSDYAEMFGREADGLRLLESTETVSVPEVFGFGKTDSRSFLVLEFLERSREDQNYWQKIGETLAQLHQYANDRFGLSSDNFIGRLPQDNTWKPDWIEFLTENRLRYQLELAEKNGFVSTSFRIQFEDFLLRLPELLPTSDASLLHGDLWNGNVMAANNKACFFDPAVYYGAREMDVAMTHLFGGFDRRFYEAYDANYPLRPEFDELVDLYNLYPLMVHVNLFGSNSGYLNSVQGIIRRYA